VVSIPQAGKKTPEREAFEKSPAFKKGQRFRAGVEGRISVLFRGRGMKRCLAQGHKRFELLVSAAVLANNLGSPPARADVPGCVRSSASTVGGQRRTCYLKKR
jgi:hypothetical protein